MAVVVAGAAFAIGASADPVAAKDSAQVSAEDTGPGGATVVAGRTQAQPVAAAPSDMQVIAAHPAVASRMRIVDFNAPQALPAGKAPERGLQVKTILVERNISVVFPEIRDIGGVRADALRWHPNGLALDVMIPNPGSAAGIALGDEIVAYALKNADRFALQDCIWRNTYYTPGGQRRGGYGHFDHVHITTKGGGYPQGGEVYFR